MYDDSNDDSDDHDNDDDDDDDDIEDDDDDSNDYGDDDLNVLMYPRSFHMYLLGVNEFGTLNELIARVIKGFENRANLIGGTMSSSIYRHH
jgi:hypothetical protein